MGYGGTVAANRILAIVSPDAAPIRRMIRSARKQGMVIDMTRGRRAKAVIILDTSHLALAVIQPETIASRLKQRTRTAPLNKYNEH